MNEILGYSDDVRAMSLPASPHRQQRYVETRRITLIGAIINMILAVGKVICGVLANSLALINDGIHSLSDLASDALVVYAARHGHREADESHPYGHARIETAATLGLGLLLIAVAMGLLMDASRRLLAPELLLHPAPLALWVAVASVLSKEVLYHYTMAASRRLRSPLLEANAWHHRTDAISSIVVIIGVAGALAGFEALDAVASAAVALMIAWIGGKLAWRSLRELVDTALEPSRIQAIRDAITDVDGVRSLHMLRTRRMGAGAVADVHVEVHPRLSASEAHYIGEFVRQRLIEKIEEIEDVTVHVDTEDDRASAASGDQEAPSEAAHCSPERDDQTIQPDNSSPEPSQSATSQPHGSTLLPQRSEILPRLYAQWAPFVNKDDVVEVILHYFSGRISVDVIVPLALANNMAEARTLGQSLRSSGMVLDEVGEVRVLFE
ncbi:MAG: cation diffusion facilitator family transporter [Proteobacteria bacterium]|nr:cation diffusion facilitator family transporter [Pseudomonadota bacterium]